MSDTKDTFSTVISWLEEPVRQSVNSLFHDLNVGVEALDLFRKYRKKHFDSIKSTLGSIKILGMSQPIPLLRIYSAAFVSTTIHSRLYEQDWHSAKNGEISASSQPVKEKQPEKISADEFIESHQRIVLLGGPGSGKTTFLRFLALAYCNSTIFKTSNLKTSKFPIFISMLAFSKRKDLSTTLLDYIIKELEIKTDKYAEYFVRRVLDKGLGVILLDALDEVSLSVREEIIREIKNLCSIFPKSKIVISCRTADYVVTFENFYEVELTKLTGSAVKKVIKAWFVFDPPKASRLIRHLEYDKSVESLTETPLLLSLICIQFSHDLSLPKRKAELYKRCIDTFLRDWDASRGFRRDTTYANLSDDRKERIFEHIAGKYFSDQIQYYFPESELHGEIGYCCERFGIPRNECKTVLQEIERHHGILERFSIDSFMFSHPSFQEYFAARDLLAKRTEFETIKKYFDDSRWSNVIEFIVSMHENPINILFFLKESSDMSKLKNYPAIARRTQHLWLLYRCMSAGVALDPAIRRQLYEHLVDTQINMASVYQNGGVIPIAKLMEDGVKHSYVFYHKRDTLYSALQPLRLLANQILMSPSEEYADVVLKKLKTLPVPEKKGAGRYSYPALSLCLSIPIASVRPREVIDILDKIIEEKEPEYIVQMAKESKGVLETGKA